MFLLPYKGILPTLGNNVYIAPNAAVVGDIHIGDNSNIWFNVSMRGDVNYIRAVLKTLIFRSKKAKECLLSDLAIKTSIFVT
jgi:carbonic anhydrase/acetyltransferase-like protein (isoleucine patch superfamily)